MNTMPWLCPPDEMASTEADRVGYNACHCARLQQAGFSVPAGVALTTAARRSDKALAALTDGLSSRDHAVAPTHKASRP